MSIPSGKISVMSALAVEVAFQRWIVPAFYAETNYDLDISWDPTTVLMKRIGDGERADVIIAIDYAIDELARSEIIDPASRIALGTAQLGLAVKAGQARPDISTLQSFKQAIIDAQSIAYSQGGASGIYFTQLAQRLGLADVLAQKAVTIPAGFTAEKIISGEAEFAVQQISELMTVQGVDVIGPFPDEVQKTTDFSAAVFSAPQNKKGAEAFIDMLSSKTADQAYRDGGLISRLDIAS